MIGARPPSSPARPPRRAEALWRRLAEDQDLALAAEELARGGNARGGSEAYARVLSAGVRAASADGSLAAPASATARTTGWRRAHLGRRRALAVSAAATTVAIAAAVVLLVWIPRKPPTLSVQVGSVSGAAPVPSLVADARADLPLRFSDGSTVTFRAGSAGRLASLSGSGAEVILERGALEAHVVHAASTAWIVRAGPYRVRVTGTRFSVAWRAADRLDLILYEGSVIVDGAALGAGVPLQAGRRLTVASGVVHIEPLATTPATSPRAVAAGQPRGGDVAREDVQEPAAHDVEHPGAPGTTSPGPAGAAEARVRNAPGGDTAASDDTAPSRTVARLETTPAHDLLTGRSPAGLAPIGQTDGEQDGEQAGESDGENDGGDSTRAGRPVLRTNRPDSREAAPDSRRRRSPRALGTAAEKPSGEEGWVALAERGRYPEALASARHLGWSNLCRRLDARRLLTLADVARYSGARAPARRAFEALARRFPRDRLAGDAVFSLGKMAFEAGRPAEAARWFHRYGADWPHGPLGDEAAGRLVESAIRLDDTTAARAAARAYLARAPQGAQAALARGVLADPTDGPP
jgi:TolA-binding protein